MVWRTTMTRVADYVTALKVQMLVLQYQHEADARRKAAAERAERLLLAHLTPEQRETYSHNGWFVVRGQSGRRYSIWTKDALFYNVSELDDCGQAVLHLCAHAAVNVPMGDHLLTQKLMLEHHEAEFRRIANMARGLRTLRQTYAQ